MNRALSGVSAGLALLLLTACGTTVPLAARGTIGGAAAGPADSASGTVADGLGAPDAGSGDPGVAAAGSPVAGATAETSAASGPATATGGPTGALTGGSVGAVGPTGNPGNAGTSGNSAGTRAPGQQTKGKPGTQAKPSTPASQPATAGKPAPAAAPATTKPLLIGYTTSHNESQTTGAVGVSGADFPDIDAIVKAVVDQQNAQGGVLGRQIKTLDFDIDIAQGLTNPSAVEGQACATFTQDNHVDAVVDTIGLIDAAVISCLAKANIPIVSDLGTSFESASDFAANLYSSDSMSVDRYVPQIVSRLNAAGFMTGWNTTTGAASPTAPVKFGILHNSTPGGMHYDDVVKSVLASAGYPISAADDVSYSTDLNSKCGRQFLCSASISRRRCHPRIRRRSALL